MIDFEIHNLVKNPNDLPNKEECKDRKILFYVRDYYANDRDCENPYYHFVMGKYLKCFYNEEYLFTEISKGYSCEFLNKDVFMWCYLPTEEEMKQIYGV